VILEMIAKFKSLQNHQGFIKHFKNTSWLFFERILRMVVGLFVGIWIARYLGPEQFGLFSYAQSIAGFFTIIASLGLDGIVIRELIKDEARRDQIIGSAFWLKLMGAFGVLGILAVAINFTSNDSYTNMLVFIIASSVIFQSFNVVDFYFQSKVMSKYVVYSNIVSLFISSIIKVTLILNEAPLESFAMVVVFDSFVLACGYVYFYLKNGLKLNWKFEKDVALELLRDAWPLIISGLSYVVYSKIDQVMLFNMIGSESVGYYSVGVNFLNMFIFLPTIIVSSLYPYLVKKSNQQNIFKIKITYLYRLIIIISLIFIFSMFVFGEKLIFLLYGIQYTVTGSIISLLSIMVLFESMAVLNGRWIWIKNLQIISMYRTIFGSILNIILNFLLIPLYGLNGAIFSTIITLFLSVIVYYIFHKETREITKTQIFALVTFYKIGGINKWVKK